LASNWGARLPSMLGYPNVTINWMVGHWTRLNKLSIAAISV
jgi:hypothetical protein